MMKKLAALLIVIGTFCCITAFNTIANNQKPTTIRTIVIDAGHGGTFPGAHGLISKEKDVTLEVALKLGEAIKKEFPNIKIVYTRTTDANVGTAANMTEDQYSKGRILKEDLHSRADISNQAKGDLFISIHCNATPQPAGGYYEKRVIGHKKKLMYVGRGKSKRKKMVNAPIYESYWVKNMRVGTESYIWKAQKTEKKGNAINQTDESGESVADSTVADVEWDTESPEARIRAQLYEQKYFKKSAMFASFVEEGFQNSGRQSYGVKQRDVGINVLEATGMPSVLIEIGFLTNKEEEEYLNSDKGQDEVVENIVNAFSRYKQQLEVAKPSAAMQTDSVKQNK